MYFGISKNPLTQNYVIVMLTHESSLHKFLTKEFRHLKWTTKIKLLYRIAISLKFLHEENLIHRDLNSGNILIRNGSVSIADFGLCSIADNLIVKSANRHNNVYGSIPFIPSEVLRGNPFTLKGDIYSFGGILYDVAIGQPVFYDQAHDTYLMTDICNEVRPKIPDLMLNWIPKLYLDYAGMLILPGDQRSKN